MKEEEFLKCQEAGQICDRKTIEAVMKTVMGLSVKTILEPVDNYNYRFAINAAKDESEVKGIKANDMIFCTALASALKMPDNVLDEHFTLGDLSSVLDTGNVDRIRTPYVMRMMSAPLRTVCIGTAASMGSIFFLAGDNREMLPHSRIMIHDPSLSGGSFAGQKPHQLQQVVDTLNECREVTCKIIADRSGHTIEEIYEKTKSDTYFKADEALEFGLATKIITSI